MNEVLLKILSISLSGSITAFLALLVSRLFQKHVSHSWRYYIWLVVIARFLLPFAPQANVTGSLFQHFNLNTESVSAASTVSNNNGYGMDLVNDTFTGPPMLMEESAENNNSTTSFSIWTFIEENLLIFWFCITLVLLAGKVTKYYSFLKFIKASRLKLSDKTALFIFNQVCKEMQIHRQPQVYTNKMIASPIFTGVFKPFILLPHTDFPEKHLECIFRHELIHYKRKDVVYKWLLQVMACIHWFNPFIYFILKKINKLCELSCDECVIKEMDRQTKQLYGDTLIAAVKGVGNYLESVAVVTLNENIDSLKERLECIMKFKRISSSSFILSLLLVLPMTTGAIYAGAYTLPDESNRFSQQATPKAEPAKVYIDEGQLLLDKETKEDIQKEKPEDSNSEDKKHLSTGRITTGTARFENGYIVVVEASNYSKEEMNAPVEIKIGNQTLPVYFYGPAYNYKDNEAVLETVTLTIDHWLTEGTLQKMSGFKDWHFRVREVAGPFQETADVLAQRFYDEDNLIYFTAVLEKASGQAYEQLMEKSIQDGKINYFSIMNIENTGLADIQAEQFYQDQKINFFSIVLDDMSNNKKRELLIRSVEDGYINFFSVLIDAIENIDYDFYAEQSYQSDQINFFSIIVPYLSDEKKLEYFNRAYNDNKINFFSVLLHSVEYLADLSTYKEKAYKDNKKNFFTVLWDY